MTTITKAYERLLQVLEEKQAKAKEIGEELGIKEHSVRGRISELRKKGFVINRAFDGYVLVSKQK